MNTVEDFQFASEKTTDKAQARLERKRLEIAALNACGFHDMDDNIVVPGDRIRFRTLYGLQSGTLLACEYRVGNVEFPLRQYVKILKDPGRHWTEEKGVFRHEAPIEIELDDAAHVFAMWNFRKSDTDPSKNGD